MSVAPDVISKTVAAAGTRVQFTTTGTPVRWAKFRARAGNGGKIYLGDNGVSSSNGYELNASETLEVELPDGVVFDLSQFWTDSGANGDKVDVFFMREGV